MQLKYATADRMEGEGTVDYLWLYESPMVVLADGKSLNSEYDLIWKMKG